MTTPYRSGAEMALANPSESSLVARLRGKRVAVLGNPTSLVRVPLGDSGCQRRVHIVDALRGAGVEVVRLFGPEHGMWATAQDMIGVQSGLDPAFKLPVASLYGHSVDSLAPRPDALDGVDVVVFDIQDVGARYYTYAATLCMTIDVCATAGAEVIVLDRANPIGGEEVEGNRVGDGFKSFVGWIDIPQRHGLSVAEIAGLYAHEAGMPQPTVIACEGWDTAAYLDELDRPGELPAWTCPSPNMPTMQTAILYPGGCLIEGTLLSEGRGTTRPFELIGGAGLDPHDYADAINALAGPGLTARPYVFEPMFQKHASTVIGGVCLEVCNRRQLASVRAGLAVIEAARQVAPEAFAWRTEVYEFVGDRLAIDLLMGGTMAREALEAGRGLDAATSDFVEAEHAFAARAKPHLLYPRSAGVLATS